MPYYLAHDCTKEGPVGQRLVIGQFSDSAVIHAIRHLELDRESNLELEVTRVPSSPAQFASLRDGDIDVAITSPDNVLLYATTDNQPLGEKLDIRMLRTIDRGLGLALFSRPEFEAVSELRGTAIGVDVVRSGFALLLFRMLDKGGVARESATFEELGATPKRLIAMQEGHASATILNAESRIAAIDAGMREWFTSADISDSYLGTVLAVRADFDPKVAQQLVEIWSEATRWLIESPAAEVATVLTAANPHLGTPGYVELLRDSRFGLLLDPDVRAGDLEELCRIRREADAYAPNSDAVAALAHS
jgi:ABC-type nitrate/sulfonate/bicarbonate transport system substrate-binding protein